MKTKALFLLVGLFCGYGQVAAQEKEERTYFDANWNKVKKPENAAYYRITQRSSDDKDKGSFADYFLSGKIQNTGSYSSIKKETKDGLWTYWHENGQKKSEENYRDGKREGMSTAWHENGNKSQETNYADDMSVGLMRRWHENGQLKSEVAYETKDGLAAIADGKAVIYHENGQVKRTSVFKNHQETETKCHTQAGKDTVCAVPFYGLPSFVGGLKTLSLFLQANVKYPWDALHSRTEGTVHITFTVDKTGKITEPFVSKGVSQELDAEALRIVKLMPAWNPGYWDGEPENVRFTLPVVFNLGR